MFRVRLGFESNLEAKAEETDFENICAARMRGQRNGGSRIGGLPETERPTPGTTKEDWGRV
jgi:hypothetical protein